MRNSSQSSSSSSSSSRERSRQTPKHNLHKNRSNRSPLRSEQPNKHVISRDMVSRFFLYIRASSDIYTPSLVWLLVRRYSSRMLRHKVVFVCDSERQVRELVCTQNVLLNRRVLEITDLSNNQEQTITKEFIQGEYQVLIILTMLFSIVLAKQNDSFEHKIQTIVKVGSQNQSQCIETDRDCLFTYVRALSKATPDERISKTCPAVIEFNPKGISADSKRQLTRQYPQIQLAELDSEKIKELESPAYFIEETQASIAEIISQQQSSKQQQKAVTLQNSFMHNQNKDHIIQALIQLLFRSQNSKKNRSLYLGLQGYQTYLVSTPVPFTSLKYVWNYLREHFADHILNAVRNMAKLKEENGAIFNVPLHFCGEFDFFIRQSANKHKHRRNSHSAAVSADYTIRVLDSHLPALLDQKEEIAKKPLKEYAIRHKTELEIFVAGLPPDFNENSLSQWLLRNNVQVFNARVLRDHSSRCKGVGFALCCDHEHFKRAIDLNNRVSIEGKSITIKLANQKQHSSNSHSNSRQHSYSNTHHHTTHNNAKQ